MKRIIGIVIGIVAVVNLFLLAFAFRDFSLRLLFMFTIALLGLPLATHLVIKRSTYLISHQHPEDKTRFTVRDNLDL